MSEPYPEFVIKDKIVTIPQNFTRNNKLKQTRYYLKLEFKKNENQVKGKNLAVLMLNPSEADINSGDPTVNKIARGTHYKYESIQIFNISPICETLSKSIKNPNPKQFRKNIKTFFSNYNNKDDILLATGDIIQEGHNNSTLIWNLIENYNKIVDSIDNNNIYVFNKTNTIFGQHPAYAKKPVNFNNFERINKKRIVGLD